MPLTCVVCNKKFTSIGTVADHISETNKGMQGDPLAGRREQMEEMRKNEKEMEHHLDALSGFTHKKFRDKNGVLLPQDDEIELQTLTMVGPKWCVACKTNFPNNFRLVEHCTSTGHGESFREIIEMARRDFEELERKYF
jgi:hypothetical protein